MVDSNFPIPPLGASGAARNLSWAALDAVERLAKGRSPISLTKGHFSALMFGFGIAPSLFPEFELPSSVGDFEQKIAKKSKELKDLVEKRPSDRWIYWDSDEEIDPDEPEPAWFLDKDETVQTLDLLMKSADEWQRHISKIHNNTVSSGNTNRERFVHWSVLRDFWRDVLGREVGSSTNPHTNQNDGPFVRYLVIMSARAPFSEVASNTHAAKFAENHGSKCLGLSPDMKMMMQTADEFWAEFVRS